MILYLYLTSLQTMQEAWLSLAWDLRSFVELTMAGQRGAMVPVDTVAKSIAVVRPVSNFSAEKFIVALQHKYILLPSAIKFVG